MGLLSVSRACAGPGRMLEHECHLETGCGLVGGGSPSDAALTQTMLLQEQRGPCSGWNSAPPAKFMSTQNLRV